MSYVRMVQNRRGGWHYLVLLPEECVNALSWLANRYESASILWAHMENNVIDLSEPDAWAYRDALAEENGNPDQIVPTCAGGTLAVALVYLYDAIE